MSPAARSRLANGYTSSFSDSRAMRQRPSGSRRQTMRKRRRTVGASEPFGPLTQLARPSVAAKSPVPSVESATISIDEILICGAAARRALRPSIAGVPGPTKSIFRVEVHPGREIGRLESLGKTLLSRPYGGDVGSRKRHQFAERLLRTSAIRTGERLLVWGWPHS
jgi:hypothetical protein